MKVEGAVAPIAVLHKIKVKEEPKVCSGFQQSSTSSTSSAPASTTTATSTTSVTSISVVSATSSSGTASTIVNPTIEPSETSIIATTVNPSTPKKPVSPNPSGDITSTVLVVSPSSGPVPQPSSLICQASAPSSLATMVNKSSEAFPVDLDLKTKVPQVLPNGPSPSRERSSREDSGEGQTVSRDNRLSPCAINKTKAHQQQVNGTTQAEYSRGGGGGPYGSAGSSGTESPLSSHSIKPENEDSPGSRQQDESQNTGVAGGNNGETNAPPISNGARCVSGVFAGHGKLKRLLGTLVQFATNISQDTGDSVRTLVLGLLSGAMTAEEFHSALQEATNFPLRGFVLPYLRHTLPSLRRDLVGAARANNQTCVQYLRSNESAVLESVSLAPSAETVDLFGDHNTSNGAAGTTSYGIMRTSSGSGVGAIQHATSGTGSLHQHYPSTPTNLATKRRASDTPYYENGVPLDDGPIYGKRSSNPWSHHAHQQQQQQQQQQPPPDPYCWYHPLHSSGGSIQAHSQSHPHGPSPVPPGLVQVNQLTSFGPPQLPHQQQQLGHPATGQTQNGSSLDDEWKNIHVMLNCILGMVEKTKRALAILQRRGSPSPAATASPLTPGSAVAAQNGSSNGNSSYSNGSPVESSTGERDAGNLKRLSGEIVAQTIRATEDRVAEVKRRAEEAVQEVKRAAVAEVQRAVAVAVAESRANERLRVHRLLDLPLPHRSHAALRQSSYIRVAAHINPNNQEAAGRTGEGTPTTTSLSGTSGAGEDEKDAGHMTNVIGSSRVLKYIGTAIRYHRSGCVGSCSIASRLCGTTSLYPISEPPSGCWNCGRTALETCGGCGIARYCGSFCQHRDWEAGGHHATCNNSPTRDRPRRSASRSPPRSSTTVGNANDTDSNGASTATATK